MVTWASDWEREDRVVLGFLAISSGPITGSEEKKKDTEIVD